MKQEPGYIPGVCNIGAAERKARRTIGWLGLVITFLLALVFLEFRVGNGWYVMIFFASSLSASGFIQDRMQFCMNFGLRHLFNFGTKVGIVQPVRQRELWAADRRKSLQIATYTFASGVVVTGIVFFVRSLL